MSDLLARIICGLFYTEKKAQRLAGPLCHRIKQQGLGRKAIFYTAFSFLPFADPVRSA
jgi:hypothetical protein